MLYQILLYLHVASVLGFFLFHGATASATYGLKRETGSNRIVPLLRMREIGGIGGFLSIMILLITGIIMAFIGRMWGELWLWASIVIFFVISAVMGSTGRNYFDRVSHAVNPEKYKAPKDKKDDPAPPTDEELAAEQAKGRPVYLTVTGLVALVLILWLMMFKPF